MLIPPFYSCRLAPCDFARAILARPVLLNPVTEFIITMGPVAIETAIILGQMLNPSFNMRSGTRARVGWL
jgi:hypothetical protein